MLRLGFISTQDHKTEKINPPAAGKANAFFPVLVAKAPGKRGDLLHVCADTEIMNYATMTKPAFVGKLITLAPMKLLPFKIENPNSLPSLDKLIGRAISSITGTNLQPPGVAKPSGSAATRIDVSDGKAVICQAIQTEDDMAVIFWLYCRSEDTPPIEYIKIPGGTNGLLSVSSIGWDAT